jgi:hypothetical protein
MTKATHLYETASMALDKVFNLDDPNETRNLKQELGFDVWGPRVGALTSPQWQIYYVETEEDNFDGIGHRIGDLIEDACLDAIQRVILWDTRGKETRRREPGVLVEAMNLNYSGLLAIVISEFEIGTRIYLVGKGSYEDNRSLGLEL